MAINQTGPVERKVTSATATALIVSAVMAYALKNWAWLKDFNDLAEYLVTAIVTGGLTYAVAWKTKHTARNDPGTRRTGTSDPGVQPTDQY